LDYTSNGLDVDDVDNGDIIIAIDSTGIKVANRGQWMADKWDTKNKSKKGHLKIHIAVNIKTKEIPDLDVTDEKVYDGKVMEQSVEQVLENRNVKIESVLAYGSYDSNKNFKYLQKKEIKPAIKVKKNSIISLKNNRLRNREVSSQIKDLFKWKKRRKYGHRWMAETVFSSIKRMFGEYVSAVKFQNTVKEMTMKVSLYNF
jgi:hypothetical protein